MASNRNKNNELQQRVPSTREELVQLYRTEGHPIAFSAPSKVYKYFGGKLSKAFIVDALEHVDAYTLHREYKRPKVYNPFYAYIRRKTFQADLITILPEIILLESFLSFLGVGIQAPMVSWGVMLNQVRDFQALASAPWLLAPVGFIVISVLSFNALGDGLRDAMDPYAND